MSLIAVFLWVLGIGAGLALSYGAAFLLWAWSSDSDFPLARYTSYVLAGVVTCFWISAFIYGISRAENESGIAEWGGGMGSETVCWFAEKDNPDTYVRSGDVSIPIDGGTSTVTRCAMSGQDIPRGAR